MKYAVARQEHLASDTVCNTGTLRLNQQLHPVISNQTSFSLVSEEIFLLISDTVTLANLEGGCVRSTLLV